MQKPHPIQRNGGMKITPEKCLLCYCVTILFQPTPPYIIDTLNGTLSIVFSSKFVFFGLSDFFSVRRQNRTACVLQELQYQNSMVVSLIFADQPLQTGCDKSSQLNVVSKKIGHFWLSTSVFFFNSNCLVVCCVLCLLMCLLMCPLSCCVIQFFPYIEIVLGPLSSYSRKK